MAKMPSKSFDKKTVGIVVATVGETKVKFTMTEQSKQKFAGDKESITVLIEDLPAFPRISPKNGDTPSPQNGKQYRIRMSSDGDTVEALSPVGGHYRMKLVDLGKRENKDSDPTPYEKQDNFKGKEESSHLEFFAVYKITKGAFKGVESAYYLHYKFQNFDGYTGFKGNFENKNSTRLFQLRDWGACHGLWKVYGDEIEIEGDLIPWDDVTILPELLERILENDIEVEGIFKNGYISEIMPVQDDDDFDDAPKKSTKERVKELGFEESTKEKVDDVFPVLDTINQPKKAKKVAKKVVDEEEEDL